MGEKMYSFLELNYGFSFHLNALFSSPCKEGPAQALHAANDFIYEQNANAHVLEPSAHTLLRINNPVF